MLRTAKKSFCTLCWTRSRQYVVDAGGDEGAIEFICPTCLHIDYIPSTRMDNRLFEWMPANWVRISENVPQILAMDPYSKLDRYIFGGWERI